MWYDVISYSRYLLDHDGHKIKFVTRNHYSLSINLDVQLKIVNKMLLLCICYGMKIIVRPKEWWYNELLKIDKMNLRYCSTITIVSIIIVNSILESLGDNFQLTVLHTNDIHSRIEQTNKYLGVCKPKDRSKLFTIHYKFCYFTYYCTNNNVFQIKVIDYHLQKRYHQHVLAVLQDCSTLSRKSRPMKKMSFS